MKLNFSVGMGRNLPIYEIGDHARIAEESGFSHMTLVDIPFLSCDVHIMMSMAALNTRRIQIGHGVTDPWTFRPWLIANGAATINELSGGRAFVGIGAGGPFGKVMKPRPLKEMREAVEFIRAFMSGEEAKFQGVSMRSEWIRKRAPIYIAAEGPGLLQLAGEIADGVIYPGVDPVIVKWMIEQVHIGAERAKRDPSEIDIWVRTMMYIADSKEKARREVSGYASTVVIAKWLMMQRDRPEIKDLRQTIERAYPGLLDEFNEIAKVFDPYHVEKIDVPHNELVSQRLIDFFYPTGTPEDICDRIFELGQLGVTNISTTLFTIIDKKGMMREIGDKIMPHFRN